MARFAIMSSDVLDRFSPATQAWFRGSFTEPTAAQAGAWEAISSGQDALVVAPTGSGKTLAAFLWALDRLASTPRPAEPLQRCRVLYVSPMKALAVDVERNLRAPLVGIGHAAVRLGLEPPDITVSVRSGDTPAADRRAFAKRPSDVLITTPESLFLLLTSAAREALTGVEAVILDEIHAVAGTKRGAHLALSLERLDALLPKPAQRIGLSATVRPVEEVARFLNGGTPVTLVQPPSTKAWDLEVVVPVDDMSALGEVTSERGGGPAGPVARTSIWPHVEERIVDLINAQRSTIVFANSRRLAERLTARLNEIWQDRLEEAEHSPPRGIPAQIMAQSGAARGAPPVLARAHHGSVSKETRLDIEEALKAGRLPAVVATSSLELGIDMGAVDLVIQVESPPSVASGLQRVGRAGHQVGARSRGVLFPKYRGDLVQTAVVVERMRSGAIESLEIPTNPLDVLAQQIVAMCALDEWDVGELHALIRRAAPFTGLSRPILDSVLDMLSGRYPSHEFAELRPRVTWDRLSDTLTARRGAQHLAVTSGGTIPDRGMFGVFLASGTGPGRRVGELDEEMVYESRVGDVFTLGTTSWRIENITHDQVLVTPAPGEPGRLPFWKGESQGRPVELGAAIGAFVREVAALSDADARHRVSAAGLDDLATDNLLAYLQEQQEATGKLPTDKTLLVERFRDEIGDWRVAIHSPFGMPVHAPWALCVATRMRERFGVDVEAMAADDGIVLRLPDVEFDDGADASAELIDLVALDPSEIHDLVTAQLPGSALFAARFRECAARALLLPRRRPDRRQPLWQQRQRAAQLLEVASQYPTFPIVLETVRECVQDVYDVPGLEALMADLAARRIGLLEVVTPSPSPFARSLLFGYVAQFLYEGDSPLAERRASALALDPTLLAELLGRGEGLALRDLLDEAAISRTADELQRTTPERAARHRDDLADLLRVLGPLTIDSLALRSAPELKGELASHLESLIADRQVIAVRIGGQAAFALAQDAADLRDALGVALPMGLPATFLEPSSDPLGALVARYARTHVAFQVSDVAHHFGIGAAVAHDALRRLLASGRIVEGEFLPNGSAPEFCDAEILRLLRRRSLAALRADVEPVPTRDYVRFLPLWQGVGGGTRGLDGVLRAVEQLSGALLPASALETLVLPARVRDYAPALLNELMAAGDVLWQGHGSLPGDDGWISLHLAESAALTLHLPDSPTSVAAPDEVTRTLLEVLAGGGAFFIRGLAAAVPGVTEHDLLAALWDLVWSGRVSGDTFAPVRALLAGGRGAHKTAARSSRPARYGHRGALSRLRLASGGLASGGPGRAGGPGGGMGAGGALGGAGGAAGAMGGVGALGGPGGVGALVGPGGVGALVGPGGPGGPGDRPVGGRGRTLPGVGRWAVLPTPESDPTHRATAAAEVLLDRYGVVTRGVAAAEGTPGGYAAIYRVLAAAEEAGRVRRGYFIESLGAAQFGTTGAIDRLRGLEREGRVAAHVLAACDPANPFGAAIPWPDRVQTSGHQPGRKAGSLVVLVDAELVLYVERGGRTLLSWDHSPEVLASAAEALAHAVHEGALGRLTVEKADGSAVLGSDHPIVEALANAGFHLTPRGLRLRR